MKPRLGLRYDRCEPSSPGLSAQRWYAELLDHVEAAEEFGIDVVWISERPFAPGVGVPAALSLCAAIAARTSRVRIATGVLPLPLHHPLRVAEDAATVDGLSGGRFELGLGLGADASGYDAFGIPAEARVARFEEGIAIIRQAWSDRPVTFDGRHFSVSELEVVPKPVQRPGPLIWIGARAASAVERAARLGDGLIAMEPGAARRFLDAWSAAGRDPARSLVALELDAVLSDDAGAPQSAPSAWSPERAVAEIRGHLDGLRDAGRVDVIFPALPAGSTPEQSLRSAELLGRVIRPQLRASLPGSDLGPGGV